MSTEHDSLTVDPRLETLLRGILASDDLNPTQNERVRARLGLLAAEPAGTATLTIPASQAQLTTSEPEEPSMLATSRTRLRRQWLQFALAAVAFIAVGVLLALLFGSGNDNPESRTGASGSPESTAATTSTATEESALPTPNDSGVYIAISLDQAQEIVPFKIVMPERVPAGLELPTVVTVVGPPPLVANGVFYRVETFFRLSGDEANPKSIQFTQYAPGGGAPNVPEAETTTTVINGVEVNRTTGTTGGGDLLTYWWATGSVNYMLSAFPEGDLTPELVEDLMLAILDSTEPTTSATPTTDPSALPTPDEMGSYRGITLEQAQEIVPFAIVMPEHVPNGLESSTITVIDFGPLASGGRRYHVQMYFEVSGSESPRKSVLFLQVSPTSNAPNMPEAETTTTTINGVEVNRTTGVNAGGEPLLAYWWTDNGISYQIMSNPEGDLTPGLVEDLMLSILVPPGPTAEEETARLEQERAEMMPFPIPDTCAASDWAGPDFRVGQQYPTAYFLDGDGLSLWTTHGLLFAGENTISWLADAPLTTTEALSGPETIKAVQSGADGATTEIPIDITEQIYNVRDTERAWWSTVNFPSEGCWEIEVSLGVHTLSATVYVYPQPPSGEFPQIDGAVMVDAAQLDSDDLPFAASDTVGTIHVVATNPIDVNSYYSVPTQALRDAGWSGGGFKTQQYASYSGWINGNRLVLITVIPGGAQDVFPDEVGAIDLGPFPDALDEVGDNEVLIYTRTAQCEEATPDDCMRKAFEAVNGPSGRP